MNLLAGGHVQMSHRLAVDERVECNVGTWELGTVVGHDYTEERLGDLVCPYQVKLDDGRVFVAPLDEVRSRSRLVAWRRLCGACGGGGVHVCSPPTPGRTPRSGGK